MPLHLTVFCVLLLLFALYDIGMIGRVIIKNYNQFINAPKRYNFYIQLAGDTLLIYTLTHLIIIY